MVYKERTLNNWEKDKLSGILFNFYLNGIKTIFLPYESAKYLISECYEYNWEWILICFGKAPGLREFLMIMRG